MGQLVEEVDTLLTPDTVEWCPSYSELLVCGTYQLSGSRRVGSLLLFRYLTEQKLLQRLVNVHSDGILDVKWAPFIAPHMAAATSRGVSLYQCVDNQLNLMATLDQQEISLSLDWTLDKDIVVSSSSGKISKFNVSQDKLVELRSWNAHRHEAWVVTGDKWSGDLVYSGADDCKLLVWDVRGPCHQPVHTCKHHEMGVCSLQSNPHQQYSLLSGSYDESLCVWDTRYFTKGPVSSCSLGGGVWRLKCHPTNPNYVLAACMHAGFQILNTEGGRLCVLWNAKLQKSEHLAYGADWRKDSNIIATCSFYNHLMQLWHLVL